MRHIFHLSIPVSNLTAAREFYERILGAEIGRVNGAWVDVLLWGHQITLQHRPGEVLSLEGQGKRHFGVVLPWQDWEKLADELVASDVDFLEPPVVRQGMTAKLYLADPSNNVIEIKAYRDFKVTFGTENEDYDVPGN